MESLKFFPIQTKKRHKLKGLCHAMNTYFFKAHNIKYILSVLFYFLVDEMISSSAILSLNMLHTGSRLAIL
jgi:hypothetical protein